MQGTVHMGLPGVPADACFSSPLGTGGGSLSSLYKMHPTLPDHVLSMVMRKAGLLTTPLHFLSSNVAVVYSCNHSSHPSCAL